MSRSGDTHRIVDLEASLYLVMDRCYTRLQNDVTMFG